MVAYKKIASLVGILTCMCSFGMEENSNNSLLPECVKHSFLLAQDHALAIFNGCSVDDDCQSYKSFRDLSVISGDAVRGVRALSAYHLGLMCKAQLGVPENEKNSIDRQLINARIFNYRMF